MDVSARVDGSPTRTSYSPRGLVAIPARLASTRLPNKLLLRRTGRPLLAHVIEQCKRAVSESGGLLAEVMVAYDDETLGAIARDLGVRAVKTGDHHRNGATRIAEAASTVASDCRFGLVVNVQGDEPELAPEAIVGVAQELLRDPTADMATLAIALSADDPASAAMKQNPNLVKAIVDGGGRAIYFSRSPIPYDRNPPANGAALCYHHLGVYAYRWDFLFTYASMPPSPLEEREGLEQLRAIDAGRKIKVGVIPASWAGKGIDTAEDYEAFVRRHVARAA